jgi:hypothetical protein
MSSKAPSVPSIVETKCVVCGLGSHRADWQSAESPHCDHHTDEEVKAASTSKTPPAPSKAKAKTE